MNKHIFYRFFVVFILIIAFNINGNIFVQARIQPVDRPECGTDSLLGIYSYTPPPTGPLTISPQAISSMRLEAGVSRQRAYWYYGLTGHNTILETPASRPLTLTATSALPPGLSIAQENATNYSFNGAKEEVIRYYLKGTPTTVGTTVVKLSASSPGCTSDTGQITVVIVPASIACSLTSSDLVEAGKTSTLKWTVKGPVSSGFISPAVNGSPNFTTGGSAQSLPLNASTIFTLTVTSSDGKVSKCGSETRVDSLSGTVSYVKTISFSTRLSTEGGGEYIYDALFWNNKFILSASCMLWFVSEDGETTASRQACIDGGAGANSTLRHGGADGNAALRLDWSGTNGFIRENSSGMPGVSCLKWADADGFNLNCEQWGPGAFKSVYYGPSGNSAYIISTSPHRLYNDRIAVMKNRVFAVTEDSALVSLPDWKPVGKIIEPPPGRLWSGSTPSALAFGDYLLGRDNGKISLYSVSSSGAVIKNKELANDPTGNGVLQAYDYSEGQPKLALLFYDQRTHHANKVLVFKLAGDSVELDKEITLPNEFRFFFDFAIWQDYIIAPLSGKPQSFDVWKGNQKIGNTKLASGFSPTNVLVSKNGYIALTDYWSPTIDIYKINAAGGTASTDGPGGGGPGVEYTPPPSSGTCTPSIYWNDNPALTQISVSSGGSAKETWSVQGADTGQVYGNCGAGETRISSGPQSYIFTNITEGFTCRVYGKIDGVEACSASATITVGAPLTFEPPEQPETTLNYSAAETIAIIQERFSPATKELQQLLNASTEDETEISSDGNIVAPPVAYDLGTTTLRQGSQGPAVMELQNFLNISTNSNLVVDGKLGPKTIAIIKLWQSASGLVADGLVGPKTKEKIKAEIAY